MRDNTQSGARPFVSVIIPVYDDNERLQRCLQMLSDQTYPAPWFEVFVVDNGSNQDVHLITQRFDKVKLTHEKKPGSYAARNKGLSVAQGEIIAFTDADCLPASDWLEKGVYHLSNSERCGLLAGKIELVAKNPNYPKACELYDQITYLNQRSHIQHDHFAATANLFTYRSVFEDVGVFKEQLKSSGDKEWGQRVYNHGYEQLYREDVLVRHPAKSSFRALYEREVRIAGGLYKLKSDQDRPLRQSIRARLRAFVPPFRKVLGPLLGRSSQKIPSIRQRIAVSLYRLILYYRHQIEYVRLDLGGEPKR